MTRGDLVALRKRATIVVHEYPNEPSSSEPGMSWEILREDGITEQAWADGSFVWYFDTGRAALDFFLTRVNG
jgi:hypothetical protein